MMEEADERLSASLQYNTDLFEAATIARMADHLQTLLEGVITDADQRLADLALLTTVERHQILVDWNATQRAYPQPAGASPALRSAGRADSRCGRACL